MEMARTPLGNFLSAKFRFWSFVSMVLLVFVHGYTIEPRYLQPWTAPAAGLNYVSFAQYLLANGLLRFRIPMLFAISGFLFALNDFQPHRNRIWKRAGTLLVPYFLWSGLHLILLYAMEQDATMRSWIVANGINAMGPEKVLLADYQWYDLMARWLLVPAPYQLWFIRVLFFYNLAYPLIAKWVTNPTSCRIFFSIAVVAWLSSMHLYIVEAEGLLFFAVGVWIQKSRVDLEKRSKWLSPILWALVALGAAFSKTWLAFNGQSWIGDLSFPMMVYLHKLTVISGLIAAWYGSDPLVRTCMSRSWFVWVSAFSFMIYAMHAPTIAILIDPTLRQFASFPQPELWTFILLPCGLIVLSIVIGASVRQIAPGMYAVLTGHRGL